MNTLPEPDGERWKPLRAGLVDLFYYDVEEFWFHDGRLLLRGNNGTGKSKVLALLLPFLLDGDLSPHRVEPDADPKKRMDWNLLLGGEHPHPERLGYTWLEFGRRDAGGATEFRTIGCGLKAVAGRGMVRHWFFVTEQRVGAGLELVDATRTALTRERLSDALSGSGHVHDRRQDYRRAVDEALFGLGAQRYGALVDLLVQLRQPQLSKRPSETALSRALTEALPPLDQAVVSDVAEAFRSLEEDRDELAAMVEAHGSARTFLGHYRRYAAVAARRRAERPRQAEQRYRQAREALTGAEDAYRAADEAATVAQEQLAALAAEADSLQVRDRALRTGPEMKTAQELERLAAEAGRRREDADAAARRERSAAEDVVRLRDRRDTAAARVHAAAETLGGLRRDAGADADTARIRTEHDERIDGRIEAALPDDAVEDRLRELRHTAHDLIARQERAITHVEGLLAAEAAAVRALTDARAGVERVTAALAALAEKRRAADAAVAAAGGALATEVRTHLDRAVELTVPDVDAVLAALELWVSALDGPNPARAAVDAAGRSATEALARAAAMLERRLADTDAHAGELAAEIARLEAGEHGAPPVPHTRDAVREGREGAPLWQLVDFADGVPDADRAGLEAALEAAGILDAWLHPDGLLRDVTGDVLIAPLDTPSPATALSTLLRPGADPQDVYAAAVGEHTITAVLDAIGVGVGDTGDGDTWVGTDGRFRVGVLTGQWGKPAAEYIGRGAREAARRARLAVLRAEAEQVAARRAGIVEEQRVLGGRQAALATEIADLPDDTGLRDAHATVGALATQQAQLHDERTEADIVLAAATTAAQEAAETLVGGAADVGLPADRASLDQARGGLTQYRVALAGLWPAVRALTTARGGERDAVADLTAAEASHADAATRATDTERDAVRAATDHATRLETAGDTVKELEAKLAEVTRLTMANRTAHDATRGERERALGARGVAEGKREDAVSAVETATAERAAAAESMRRFAATGLLAVALPDLPVPEPDGTWAPDPTVRLARQIDQALDTTTSDDQAWDRVQRRLNDEVKDLTDTLARHGNRVSAQMLDDGIVVDVVFRGRPATIPELTAALDGEVTDRKRLLDEREREILENHLVNEVASTLQELITESDQQVRRMNGELSDRPTSTGMRLRLQWLPRADGPSGLAEARRRLLRQTSDAWSAADRAAVGEFLQNQIAEVRARDETGTWLEHLTTALDYRTWHRFVIERHQNGQWRSATGPASGGERVLAASVPLFAAASAHYGSAGNPHAPRLVMLDEAFAGVDDNARAKYLGLLSAFDLDVVMTSEREWACYPEVPGIAIAQLARTDGVAAVLVTNWRWDGSHRTLVPRPEGVPANDPATEDTDDAEALF